MPSAIISTYPLGLAPWQTEDPFLFCVYHRDHYPKGNGSFGPADTLAGRQLGSDFEIRNGYRMYHGETIPGFPAHPHRGFETVTVVEQGLVDHADSLGAAGRYSAGDTQWMTAGKGIQHSEMFPLLNTHSGNDLELFQIWLNLSAANKMVDPHFLMLWQNDVPVHTFEDGQGGQVRVKTIAGELNATVIETPPDSWAANATNDVAIWIIRVPVYGRWALPITTEDVNRNVYFYQGESVSINDQPIELQYGAKLSPNVATTLRNTGSEEAYVLLLQGKPIAEPVVNYGPFVMNTDDQIQQAFADYRRDQFGGWPWPSGDPVHAEDCNRFAQFSDGSVENPD